MRKKTLATTLIAVGIVLASVSTVSLFLIALNRTSYMYVFALSGSMEPTFSKGAALKVELGLDACEIYAAPEDANPPGDVIAFNKPTYPLSTYPDLIVHRAVEKHNEDGSCSFTTKGDANSGPDWWTVRESDVVGRVVAVNPPIWEYGYLFWIFMLAVGGVIIVLGAVVFRASAPKVAPPPPPVPSAARPKAPLPSPAPAPTPTTPTKIHCVYCGGENPLHADFCLRCGKKLVKP